MKNVFFRYERSLPDVLRGASLCVYKGEFYCLLGGNGTGKTTTLNVLAGLNRAYRGKVRVGGRPIGDYKGGALYRGNLALLPQNPQTVFVRDRLRDDFAELLEAQGVQRRSGTRGLRRSPKKSASPRCWTSIPTTSAAASSRSAPSRRCCCSSRASC